ncbi:MAG: Hsp20/alpha crystallin family protein [Chloroflexi bacterium]|nr:Hsp20/alpha crystallin family protein [Chloroflexota bacterium]
MNRDSVSNMRWGLSSETAWCPPTDVYETDDNAVVMVEIAGLAEGDYEVMLVGRQLVISGERRDPAEKLTYQQMEIRYGKFRTQVLLPWALDLSGQVASYENGFLRVLLRKAQARRVPVRVTEDPRKGTMDTES